MICSAVQEYVRKMSLCLLDISSDSSSPSLEQLQRFSLELTGIFVSFWIGNPQHIAMLQSVNMQTGLLFDEPPPENLHEDLLVRIACAKRFQTFAISCELRGSMVAEVLEANKASFLQPVAHNPN